MLRHLQKCRVITRTTTAAKTRNQQHACQIRLCRNNKLFVKEACYRCWLTILSKHHRFQLNYNWRISYYDRGRATTTSSRRLLSTTLPHTNATVSYAAQTLTTWQTEQTMHVLKTSHKYQFCTTTRKYGCTSLLEQLQLTTYWRVIHGNQLRRLSFSSYNFTDVIIVIITINVDHRHWLHCCTQQCTSTQCIWTEDKLRVTSNEHKPIGFYGLIAPPVRNR